MEQKQLQSNLFKSCRLPGCTICRVNEGRNIKGLLFLVSPSSQSEQKHCTGHSLVVIRLSLNNERLQFYRVFVTGNFSLWTQELFCPNETQKSEKGTSVADVLWSNIHTWIELLQLAIYSIRAGGRQTSSYAPSEVRLKLLLLQTRHRVECAIGCCWGFFYKCESILGMSLKYKCKTH